jgi:hypothetical protein
MRTLAAYQTALLAVGSLALTIGDLILGGASHLDAFSDYPYPT